MKLTPTRVTAAAVSTAFNLGLVALVMQAGAQAPPVWDEIAMTVELVQVRGSETQPPSQSAQAPTSPPREPAPATPPPEPSPPQPRPDAPQPAAASPVALPAAATAAASVAPSAAPAAAQNIPAPPPPPRAGTREGLDIDAPNGASLDYASRLRAWLEAHKTYPKRARMRREEGVVQLQFAVDRQGRLLRGDVVRSSGYASLDAEAMAMLNRSNPFPSAPHSVRGERIEVSTPVEFFIQR